MTDDAVRFALLGYGSGGRYFHAPLIASAAGCAFVGVVTRSADRRSLLAADHPTVAHFDTIEELHDVGVEALAISTPADTHSELTDRALNAGLHVVCDKPFALDAASAARSVQLAADVGRLLSPYQNRRWDSDFLTVRDVVESGRLGTVITFESRFERFAPERGPGAAGGGALLDFGSHLVDQALVLFGPVSAVYAEWRVRETGRDDDALVALTHERGTRSHLWGSWSQGAPLPRFRVQGTSGAYLVDGPMDGQEAALIAGDTPSTLGAGWGVEPESRWGAIRRGGDVEIVPTLPGAWHRFYEQFAAAVQGHGPVPVPATDAVETARALDAARRSAQTGMVVEIERDV